MSVTETKPFTDPTCSNYFGKLEASRMSTELKAWRRRSQAWVLVKSLLATAALAVGVAVVVLFHLVTSYLGIGIGVLIVSAYAIHHYGYEHKQINSLYRTARAALAQI